MPIKSHLPAQRHSTRAKPLRNLIPFDQTGKFSATCKGVQLDELYHSKTVQPTVIYSPLHHMGFADKPYRGGGAKEKTMSSSSSSKKITLKSSDGEAFEVEEIVALESQTIKHMVEDDCVDSVIPLPNVTSKILAKVVEYCKKHVEAAKSEDRSGNEDLKAWDAEFVKVDQPTLFDLILAANYLNIRSLLDLTCQTVADMIKGKTPEEIRKTFHIKNDFTPDEEEEVRRENQWAFE
ncbi:hypothetical protein NMG60_11007816 [Bertholletia excelsa]